MVDAVSKPTPKQLGYSMRARAEMCLLLARARRESACGCCALTASYWELRGDCRLIYLVSSSSFDDTPGLLAQSDILTWPISPVAPVINIDEARRHMEILSEVQLRNAASQMDLTPGPGTGW